MAKSTSCSFKNLLLQHAPSSESARSDSVSLTGSRRESVEFVDKRVRKLDQGGSGFNIGLSTTMVNPRAAVLKYMSAWASHTLLTLLHMSPP